MASQVETIINHVDKQMDRMYDPLVENVRNLKGDVYGNGKDGLKTRMSVMETDYATFKQDIKDEIEDMKSKLDRSQWFLITTMGLTLLNLILSRLF